MGFSLILSLICVAAISDAIGKELDEGCVDSQTFLQTVVPPRLIHVNKTGNLYSPGFVDGELYPDNIRCSFRLVAPPGMHVRIHFNQLDIEVADLCETDILTVAASESLSERICGNLTLPDYVSKTNAMNISFKSNEFLRRRGFNITFSVQTTDKLCSSGQKQCHNRNCVDNRVVCDGNDDCGDGTDEERCPDRVLPISPCGRPEIDPVSFADFDRIVGGRDAVHGSWPWMVSLQVRLFTPNAHFCGGTLLDAQWVLTAAHCFEGQLTQDLKMLRIHIGANRKFEKDDSEQIRYPKRIVIHDDKTPQQLGEEGSLNYSNDIALIQLNAPIQFSKYVKPICLPVAQTKLNITSNCYATGWGITRGSGHTDRLKQAYHPVQSDVICERLMGEYFVPRYMICAGSMASLNGACKGDSGGPLVCQQSDGRWNIEGVASFVTDGTGYVRFEGTALCGTPGHPSVFNKVAVKTSWIRKIINKYSS